MICQEHIEEVVVCPNQWCDTGQFKVKAVPSFILNQLASISIHCTHCNTIVELSDLTAHFHKSCPSILFDRCPFNDCNTFVTGNRHNLEQHLLEWCASHTKQCKDCEVDLLKMYGNEEFREAVYGHLCKRDYILFLFEGMMDVEDS